MNSLFAMRYVGAAGLGAGAVVVGNGKIIGIDGANGRYHGSYTEQNGRMRGTVNLSIPGGGFLVTGHQLRDGQQIQLQADWASNLGDGQPRQVSIGGLNVAVTFEKIGDVH